MKKLVSISKLTHRYDTRTTAGISNLSFDINQGEIISLIGPSGSGKTTTLKCLANIIKEYQGEITFSSESLISLVSQESNLDNTKTVLENLDLSLVATIEDPIKRENQIRSVLAELEITNEINSLIQEISGGQKQRVLIAKALIHNPTLLFLDEPFANLDKILRTELLEELFTTFRKDDLTVVWVTHNTEEALAYSDRTILLDHGELKQIGVPRELILKPKNMFTANFFGHTNMIASKIISLTDSEISVKIFDEIVLLKRDQDFKNNEHKDILLIIRPEFIKYSPNGILTGLVIQTLFMGGHQLVQFNYMGTLLWSIAPNFIELSASDSYAFDISSEYIWALSEV